MKRDLHLIKKIMENMVDEICDLKKVIGFK
jgi:hypothetical protein